jgi:hypothetical protein
MMAIFIGLNQGANGLNVLVWSTVITDHYVGHASGDQTAQKHKAA